MHSDAELIKFGNVCIAFLYYQMSFLYTNLIGPSSFKMIFKFKMFWTKDQIRLLLWSGFTTIFTKVSFLFTRCSLTLAIYVLYILHIQIGRYSQSLPITLERNRKIVVHTRVVWKVLVQPTADEKLGSSGSWVWTPYRSRCHLYTSLKLFWSQLMAPWTSAAVYECTAALPMNPWTAIKKAS